MKIEEKKYCYKYPRPAVTTDCVVFGFDGTKMSVLLVERGQEPFKGEWALPGGFLNMDETAEEGAARELYEETGVKDIFIEQLQAFSKVDRDPRKRVITIAFYALVRQNDYHVVGGDDAASAQWFPLQKLPPLAFDHDYILRMAIKRLRIQIHFEPIVFHLLDKKFTMPQLQCIYECITGVPLDPQEFRKKILVSGYIHQLTGSKEESFHSRPCLYSFDEKRYNEVKDSGKYLDF